MGSSMIYQGYTQEMRTKKKHMEYNIEQIQGASIAISLPSESREVPCLPRHCNVWLWFPRNIHQSPDSNTRPHQHASRRDPLRYQFPPRLRKYHPSFFQKAAPLHAHVQAVSWIKRQYPTRQYGNADNMAQGHNDALALVNVHKNITGSDSTESSSALADKSPTDDKADLRRAKELVELHYEMKARHANGTVDEELSQARRDVQRVLRELSTV